MTQKNTGTPEVAEATKTIWDRLRDIPQVISSLIAIVAAIGALFTWLFAYFASKEQLNTVRIEVARSACVAHLGALIAEKQIELMATYNEFSKAQLRIEQLQQQQKIGSLTPAEQTQLVDEVAQVNKCRDEITSAKQAEMAARAILISNDILDAAGKCKM